MHRTHLLQALAKYRPTAPEEIEYKSRIIQFINEQSHCFERSLLIGHITASAWLLNTAKTHALLMHHTKLNKWVQLGGHCDGDSNPLSVAIKEAQEESGIVGIAPLSNEIFDIDIHLIPANSREPEHYHYDIRFLLGVVSNENFTQNAESKELRWVNMDRIALPTDSRSVVRMLDKWVGMNL